MEVLASPTTSCLSAIVDFVRLMFLIGVPVDGGRLEMRWWEGGERREVVVVKRSRSLFSNLEWCGDLAPVEISHLRKHVSSI